MPRHNKSGVTGLYRDETTGRWSIDLRWKDPTTGKVERYRQRLPEAISPAVAKRRALKILNSAQAGTFDPDREEPETLHAVINKYLTWVETEQPAALRNKASLSRTIKRYMSDMKLDEISPFALDKFKAERKRDGARPATINRAVAQLKHMMKWATARGWMSWEKATTIREAATLLKEPTERVRSLTEDEEIALFAALKPKVRAIVEVADLTGMRRSEVVLLKKTSVDLSRRVIKLDTTKSDQAHEIPICDDLAVVLKPLMEAPGEWVFTSTRNKPYTPDAVTRAFHRAVVKAGISNLRFHDLRHDFATKLRRAGTDISVVQKLLNHKKISTTARYAHVEDAAKRQAVASLKRVAQPFPTAADDRDEKPNVIHMVATAGATHS